MQYGYLDRSLSINHSDDPEDSAIISSPIALIVWGGASRTLIVGITQSPLGGVWCQVYTALEHHHRKGVIPQNVQDTFSPWDYLSDNTCFCFRSPFVKHSKTEH